MAEIKRWFYPWLQSSEIYVNGYWRSEKEFNAVFGLWIIELTCFLKQVDKCIQRAARACLHICFLYCLVLLCHVCLTSPCQRFHWSRAVRTHMIHSMAWWLEAAMRHLGYSGLSGCVFVLKIITRPFFFWICSLSCIFSMLFQKGPESGVHRELLVFGSGADQAGEQRPRHPQRNLQQQCHCPVGARGRGCHQTFQKGQNQNGVDEDTPPWPFLTHKVTQLICSNHDWRHANKYM